MPTWTEEQKKAIYETGKNILVSAGAGSGKTAVLTERVLEKLKSGIHIDELLILTFTNAASLEMKERIRNKIKKEPSLKEELKRIDAAYITTFDSFAFSILKKYHYKKNISNQARIIDSSVIQLLKRKTLTKLFDEYYKEENESFLNFIRTFSVKDDEKIKENILAIYNKIEQRIDKEEFLKCYIENHTKEEYIAFLKKEYFFFIERKKLKLQTLLEQLKLESDGSFYEKMSEIIQSILRDAIFPDRLPSVPKDSTQTLKNIKEEIKMEIDSLKEWMDDEKIHIKNYEKTLPFAQTICEILLKLDKEIISYKEKEDAFEFIDIEILATKLILENEEIKNELKEKFKEIMIDEYQDTNDLQEFFISLIENNNVYMVGDIKQSIYRFRNANPNIFKEKYDAFKASTTGIRIDMNRNFRSREEVIDDINHLFSSLMEEDMGGINYKLEHQMIFGNKMYLQHHQNQNYHMEVLSYDQNPKLSKEKLEATLIANDIERKINEKMLVLDKETSLLRPIQYKDFAILLDRTTYAEEYKKIFEANKIPLEILKDESILNNDLISIIKNIIHYLFLSIKKENIQFYFTSIARSFLFEYTDQQIFDILTEDQINQTEIQDYMNQIKEKIPYITSGQMLEEIIKIFKIEEKLLKIGNIKENEKILDTITKIAQETTKLGYTPYEFNEFLEEIFENKLDIKLSAGMTSEDGVKLMTIHKSKGLEFPICYFAGLQKKFNISDLNDLFLYDKNFGIITPYDEEGLKDTFIKEIIKEKYIEEEIGEKIRLFYVALTRAKEQLIFITPTLEEGLEDKNKWRSFYDLLNTNYLLIEPFLKKVEIKQNPNIKEHTKIKIENIPKIEVVENSITESIKEEKSFSKRTYSLLDEETKKNIEFGKKLHSMFENIDFLNINEIDENSIYITNFLKHDLLKNIKNATIYKEYEFMYQDYELKYHGIIDFMLVYEDHIDIIDYKLKYIEDDAYLEQLKGYQSYIQKKFNKPVKIYLYSILDNKMKEL